jgi:hypothetical protein
MVSIVRSPGMLVDVSQGFHLSVEFRVEVLQGTGGFGVSLRGERGGVEESLMQARIGLDPDTLLPVAFLSAVRPSGEQAMQIGLLDAIAPGTTLRFDLSYDAALREVTARMMNENTTLFDRSVEGFVVDFPVGVVLNVFAAGWGRRRARDRASRSPEPRGGGHRKPRERHPRAGGIRDVGFAPAAGGFPVR